MRVEERRECEGQQAVKQERQEQQKVVPQQRQRVRHQRRESAMRDARMMPIMAGHLGGGMVSGVLGGERGVGVEVTCLQ